MSARRDQIHGIAGIGFSAKQAADRIRTGERVRLSAELAERVDAFLAAADAVAALAEDEVIALEAARDWGEP
jgi:hypothetical protein